MRRSRSKLKKTKKAPSFRVSGELERLLNYWLEALKESERGAVERQDLVDGVELPFDEVERGSATRHAFDIVLAQDKKDRPERREVRNDAPQPVLLSVLRFEKENRDEPGPRFVEALWIPAILAHDGSLAPPQTGLPWIPREHLEPAVTVDSITVGVASAMIQFGTEDTTENFSTWKEYWKYLERFAKGVTGERLNECSVEGYKRRPHVLLIRDPQSHDANRSLKRLLAETASGARFAGLLRGIATLADPKRRPVAFGKKQIAAASILHCGQFGDSYPLAASQRRAVQRLLLTKENDYLCVTGPPGTGKTTMIQSVIASVWVQAARSGMERPPVVVAVGATNQAVMNVIDSLEKSGSSQGILAARWLPEIHSYGTFCCSRTKAAEAQAYQLELQRAPGMSVRMEQDSYVALAERQYLSRFEEAFGSSASVKGAVKHFRTLLLKEYAALYRAVADLRTRSFSEWAKELIGIPAGLTAEQVFDAQPPLDSLRHRAFLFAAHYWEGRWLLQVRAELERRRKSQENSARLRTKREDWQLRAMVTPAFVSTLAMLPRFFGPGDSKATAPVDLLIFDEAGQIPVETGVACLALAKRALIVGDCAQLEPMWMVTPHVDRTLAERQKLVRKKDVNAWDAFNRRGLSASSGSIMYLAMRSVREIDSHAGKARLSVFLREQRRCVPELVDFSNRLCYGGRLEAKRLPLEPRILPAFGYLHVPGTSQKSGQSRWNLVEVEQIAAWIEHNEKRILEYYGARSLAEVLAVISPFSAQIRKLKQRLRKRYPDMTIGTVSSLQGAERHIVLFSTVYDSSFEGTYFFDRGTNMLNVAVSRAKDSFLVFGDMEILDPAEANPSSILAQFLFADPANELPPVRSVQEKLGSEQRWHIDTLQEHREILAESFALASQRLVIISPTISIYAMRNDNIAQMIRTAVARGVRVIVFTDSHLDCDRDTGSVRAAAAEGRQALIEAGAELRITRRIHNKVLAVDDSRIVSGSFNWLSAVRSTASDTQKFEESDVWSGGLQVRERIRKLIAHMEHRSRLWEAERELVRPAAAAVNEDPLN